MDFLNTFFQALPTRFLHSIGVFHIAEKAFDRLFKNKQLTSDLLRLKETFKLGCLLHDIGHAPLSHSTETVMPTLGELNIPKEFLEEGDDLRRQATRTTRLKVLWIARFLKRSKK